MKLEAADRWLKGRLQMPTALKSDGLARLAPAIRAHAFFSAGVAQGHVLAKLREVSDAFTRGEMDLATARKKLKDWLGKKEEPGSKEDRQMGRLWSTARLNLILRQNARMAQAVGEWEQGQSDISRKLFPYWRYVASVSESPRGSHRAYAGKVWRKEDPIWHRIFPPWDFNCKCSVEEVAADEVEPDDVEPTTTDDMMPDAAESGFAFDPADAFNYMDAENIQDEVLRCNVVQEMQSRFGCTAEEDTKSGHLVLILHGGWEERAAERIQEDETYFGWPNQPMMRYRDKVSGEVREDVWRYVASFEHKGEATTNNHEEVRKQRRADIRAKPAESAAACHAYLQLSEGERHSLDAYTSRDPYRLNLADREQKTLDAVQTREKERLLQALDKLPTYTGTVYRGMGLPKKVFDSFMSALRSGRENPFKGFLSTSWDFAKAMNYAMSNKGECKMLFVIEKSTKGHFLGPVSCTPDDEEILYAMGQKFKVVGERKDENGVNIINLEEV